MVQNDPKMAKSNKKNDTKIFKMVFKWFKSGLKLVQNDPKMIKKGQYRSKNDTKRSKNGLKWFKSGLKMVQK